MGQMSRRTKAATVGPHQPRVIDGLCPPQWSGPVGAGPPAPGSSSLPLPPKSGAEPRRGFGACSSTCAHSFSLCLLSVSFSQSVRLSEPLFLSFNLSVSLNLNLSFSLRPPPTFNFSKAALRSPLPRKSPSAVGCPD